jgi:nitric oxide reductase large subunit
MKKIIGLILLVGGIGLGVYAYNQSQDDKATLKIGDIELSAKDKKASNETLILYAVAGIAVLGGLGMVTRK